MTPYRIEFFDRQLNYMLLSVVEEPEIKMDYLTLDKTSVSLPSSAEIQSGWFCQLKQGNRTVYQGVVASVTQTRNSTTVQCTPLIALFDTQVYKNRTSYQKTGLEQWIADILSENFVSSGDSVQNIFGLQISTPTVTNGVALNLENNILDFWRDVARKAIENAKVVIECSFTPQSKTFNCVVKSYAAVSEITLEADLPPVIKENFTLREDESSVNKVVIVNQENESEQNTYYANPYLAPTVRRIESIMVETGKTFAECAKDKADELLKKTDFDNLIELQYRVDDPLIPEIRIGQPCRIIRYGTVYHTVLTGVTRKAGVQTLLFGGVRVDFTKILKMKGAV